MVAFNWVFYIDLNESTIDNKLYCGYYFHFKLFIDLAVFYVVLCGASILNYETIKYLKCMKRTIFVLYGLDGLEDSRVVVVSHRE